MCLIAIAHRVSTRYPLVVAANRDESHTRPSAPAAWWADEPRVFGGRDLVAGGSWLAVDASGRLAAVTNVYEGVRRDFPRSRGELVERYLAGDASALAFLAAIESEQHRYGPFNLLLYDGGLHYASNRESSAELGPGIHVLSNAVNGVSWPKILRARDGMQEALRAANPILPLLALLAERASLPLPDEDSRAHREATLFVADPSYGTRSSTIVLADTQGELTFVERRFDARGETSGETTETFAVVPSARR